MMQRVRLETKERELISEIEMPMFAVDEPDVIVWAARVFIRRPMIQREPPKKNDPETYFEAFTWYHSDGETAPAPAAKFAKVTDPESKTAEPPAASPAEEETIG